MKSQILLNLCTALVGASAMAIPWAKPAPRLSKRAVNTSLFQSFPTKPRVFIISDISNEPDDQESLVRFLTYSNEFQVEGIVASTSTWRRTEPDPQSMHNVVDGYAQVVDNLNANANPDSPYESAEYFHNLIQEGPHLYGMDAVGALDRNGTLTNASLSLYNAIIAPTSEPLWVTVWGGASVLAQVLYKISLDFDEEQAQIYRSRVRVYAISDQDDTGVWIRTVYPDVFYIASVHTFNYYGLAAWSGMSGETYYGFDYGGPDSSLVSHDWLRENIRIGPLGAHYGDFAFIPEGDTPSFLYLIQNGLGVSEHPEYGSWGGRYNLTNPGLTFPTNHYSDAADQVVGLSGRTYRSNQATVWRWRRAYQNDFAARMQWTLTNDTSKTNHQPVVAINGTFGYAPVNFQLTNGSSIVLSTEGTYDPDGDDLTYSWWQYREATSIEWAFNRTVPAVGIEPLDSSNTTVRLTVPWNATDSQVFHVILEVKDNGTPQLTSYRRVVFGVTDLGA